MTRVQMTQAVAADYADAMLVARRAKNVLFFFLALVLLIQMGVFFVVRYVPAVKIRGDVARVATTTTTESAPAATTATAKPPTTVPVVDHKAAEPTGAQWSLRFPCNYVIAVTDFLGIVLSIVLAAILLLIITIMLVGRLIGVSHVTGAFCWSIVLIVMLFPWQSLLNSKGNGAAAGSHSSAVAPGGETPDIMVPGVLYTFAELVRDYDFPNDPLKIAILKWCRYVAFPGISVIILLMIHGRSGRGLRFALGEAEVTVETPR